MLSFNTVFQKIVYNNEHFVIANFSTLILFASICCSTTHTHIFWPKIKMKCAAGIRMHTQPCDQPMLYIHQKLTVHLSNSINQQIFH